MITQSQLKNEMLKIMAPTLIDQWLKTLDNEVPVPNTQTIEGNPVYYSVLRISNWHKYNAKKKLIYKYYTKKGDILNVIGYLIRDAFRGNKHLM